MSRLVALTGATGFIGWALAKELSLIPGITVRAIHRRSPPPSLPQIQWIPGHLGSRESLANLISDADIVIHCAGVVRGRSLQEFVDVNTTGTENLLETSIRQGVFSRFLYISSLAAREPGLSWYAHSKSESEKLLRSRADTRVTIFRPTAVYGPGDREILPLLRIMRLGLLPAPRLETRFSLLHISDLVKAVMQWIRAEEAITGTYELDDGSPCGYNWAALTELASQIWGKKVFQLPVPVGALKILSEINLSMAGLINYSPMLTPGKVRELTHPDWTCDIAAATAALDWQPEIKLADAMRNPLLLGN